MGESETSEFKTSFNNNNANFASPEPFLKFYEPNISHNFQKKDYLKNKYQFVTLNEKENFGIECPSPKERDLPNYIVPVLYVPHGIVTNKEELLQVTQLYPPKQNKKLKVILTDSENEMYQRLTKKLGGVNIFGSDHDDGTTDNKSSLENLYQYHNPRYTITSNSENCLSASSSQNEACPISPKPIISNDVPCMTDNTRNFSNMKFFSLKNSNTATPKKVDPVEKPSIKRDHSRILKVVKKKRLHSDAGFTRPHLQSKITQTKHIVKQISTQTQIKEEETHNVEALLDPKNESKAFSSCTNVPDLLDDYLIFNDGIEIITPEDFIEASFIPLMSSPLNEIMTPKLRTHSN